MLYLSRKTGESIIIDDSIEMCVSSVSGNIVNLGFLEAAANERLSNPRQNLLLINFGSNRFLVSNPTLDTCFDYPRFFITRKTGDSVLINETTTITIIETQGQTVKFGFEFPKTTSVLRKELWEANNIA